MTVAIHQPNLFPWLGFFQKIQNADVFVYLDHTLTNPRNPLWQKRVKLLLNGKANWITVPLKSSKEHPFQELLEIEIQELPKWDVKLKRSIEQNYSKAPFFEETMELVGVFFNSKSKHIAERNIAFIDATCEYLEIKTQRARSSKWKHQSTSNELLVDIVNELKGTVYLAGDGADGYQELEPFEKADISLENLNYQHPNYAQFNTQECVKGLSIVDVLMNLGKEGVQDLLGVFTIEEK